MLWGKYMQPCYQTGVIYPSSHFSPLLVLQHYFDIQLLYFILSLIFCSPMLLVLFMFIHLRMLQLIKAAAVLPKHATNQSVTWIVFQKYTHLLCVRVLDTFHLGTPSLWRAKCLATYTRGMGIATLKPSVRLW